MAKYLKINGLVGDRKSRVVIGRAVHGDRNLAILRLTPEAAGRKVLR